MKIILLKDFEIPREMNLMNFMLVYMVSSFNFDNFTGNFKFFFFVSVADVG